MPGFDAKGPRGKGPFTGRGMGFCAREIDRQKTEDIHSAEDKEIKKKKEVSKMPGGNGTGPLGSGPMTGRPAGYCAGYPVPGYANSRPGGFVSPVHRPVNPAYGFARPPFAYPAYGWGGATVWGRRFGRGRGCGRGFGRGGRW